MAEIHGKNYLETFLMGMIEEYSRYKNRITGIDIKDERNIVIYYRSTNYFDLNNYLDKIGKKSFFIGMGADINDMFFDTRRMEKWKEIIKEIDMHAKNIIKGKL